MKIFAKIALAVVLLSVVPGFSFAQQQEVLSNSSIIQLKKAGLSASVIKSKISLSACNFNNDTNSLVELKNAGVDDDIIEAMLKKQGAAIASPPITSDITSSSVAEPQEKWGKMDGNDKYITSKGVVYTVGQKLTLGDAEYSGFKYIIKFSPFSYSPDDSEYLHQAMSRKDVYINKIIITKDTHIPYLIFSSGGRWGIEIEKALPAKEVNP